MDGMAAMRVIRSLYPECHLVVVTHYDGHTLRRRALAAGADHFITKDALLELVPYVRHCAARWIRHARQAADIHSC